MSTISTGDKDLRTWIIYITLGIYALLVMLTITATMSSMVPMESEIKIKIKILRKNKV